MKRYLWTIWNSVHVGKSRTEVESLVGMLAGKGEDEVDFEAFKQLYDGSLADPTLAKEISNALRIIGGGDSGKSGVVHVDALMSSLRTQGHKFSDDEAALFASYVKKCSGNCDVLDYKKFPSFLMAPGSTSE
eukprot:g3932.t1